MVCFRVGSATWMGWNRRSSAASLLDVLAVLVERRRTDGLQLTAGEHRLEDGGGVDRALGRSGTDEGVDLVDEEDDVAPGPDLLEHLAEALLEVTAVADPATKAPRSRV